MNWHVIRTNSGSEKFVADRIKLCGFISHVPEYVAPKRGRGGKATRYSELNLPLFPTYLFAQLDASFRKEKIETSKVRLVVFRKKLLTDEHLTIFNEVALAMTTAKGDLDQFRRDRMPKVEARAITPGDIMQILHGAMTGVPVEVLRIRKDEILIGFKERPEYRPVWINASSLAKAV